MAQSSYLIFVQCSLGLEALLQDEVGAWGRSPRALVGGVELRVDQEGLWRVCLMSRLAEGVRIRLKLFKAVDFSSLQKELRKLPFRAYLPEGARVAVKVSCQESKLWHSGAVQERVAAVLQEHVGWVVQAKAQDAAGRSVTSADAFLHTLFVRLENDEVQVSLDAAGPRLHQRGERTRVESASLRETLAAALVRLARGQWERTRDGSGADALPGTGATDAPALPPVLWDPFCGAGTIALEWCGAALGRVPGWHRECAFFHFKGFDAAAFAQVKEQLVSSPGASPQVIASDRSERAVQATRGNVEGAGYAELVQVVQGDVAAVAARVPEGACVVTNPPYGRRLHDAGGVKTLLRVLKERPDLRPVVTLVGGAAHRLIPTDRPALARFKNGGLNVSARLVVR